MINRKTKRQSPPPYKNTIATTIDDKRTTSDSFSKWSKVLHLLSPPHKKRRAFDLIGQQDRWSSDEDTDTNSTCSSISSKSSITANDDDQIVPSPSPVLKRERSMDQISKQKALNRRAMYIPSTTTIIFDGPKDSQHQWTLYCATHQKLRRNTLPLSESLHLRRMLVTLQQQLDDPRTTRFNSNKILNKEKLINLQEDEEDDIPLGALLEKNKKPVNNKNFKKLSINANNKKMTIPPTSSIKAFYNNRRLPSLHNNNHKGISMNHYNALGFPHYYNGNSATVQYI